MISSIFSIFILIKEFILNILVNDVRIFIRLFRRILFNLSKYNIMVVEIHVV